MDNPGHVPKGLVMGDDGHWKGLGWGYVPFSAQFLVLVLGPCAGSGSILASVCLFLKYVQYPSRSFLNKSIVITQQYDLYD